MPILKHRFPKAHLNNNCLLCDLGNTESIHHILTECPAYKPLQQHFNTFYLQNTNHFLSDLQLCETDMTQINRFTLNSFLVLRWKKLNPLLNTIKADCLSSIATSHSGFLPESNRTASWGDDSSPCA